MPAFWIIAYDITDNRRRARIDRVLKNYAARVQESVFECHITAAQHRRVMSEIAILIDAEQDKVRYYALCGKDRGKLQVLGNGSFTPDVAYWRS